MGLEDAGGCWRCGLGARRPPSPPTGGTAARPPSPPCKSRICARRAQILLLQEVVEGEVEF